MHCRGSNSLLFVRLEGAVRPTPLFLQSKSSIHSGTVTYAEIHQEAWAILEAHNMPIGDLAFQISGWWQISRSVCLTYLSFLQ